MHPDHAPNPNAQLGMEDPLYEHRVLLDEVNRRGSIFRLAAVQSDEPLGMDNQESLENSLMLRRLH